jgi:putative ABC transport system permease protein
MNAFIAAPVSHAGPSFLLPMRLALRELRAGLRGFAVFILCIGLGVMTITAVGSFARGLSDGLAREGRTILGGDISFALFQREATESERRLLASKGDLSAAATMRAMARSGTDGFALVEIKAVDRAYPLYGAPVFEPPLPLADVFAVRDGKFGAAADAALLARLGIAVGATITVGSAQIEIRAVLRSEPDKLAGGVGFGPRLLIGEEALRATGLLQPGSLVRWMYRLRLPSNNATDAAAEALIAEANTSLPDAGWEIRTRANASPQLERNIERFTQFLTLVGLAALLVGGVGVANAVTAYLERKRAAIATLKALGATSGAIFSVYLTQVMLVAGVGTLAGLVVGSAIPFAIAAAFGGQLPLPLEPGIYPSELALGAAYGLLTALAFALLPLGHAHDVPVSALFRDHVAPDRRWPRLRYGVSAAALILLLAAMSAFFAYDRRIALIFIVAAAAVFVALRLIAALLMTIARRLPRPRSAMLRLAVSNIHRPGALTPSVVLSLGLGLAVLVTVALIDGNLQRQFAAALPERAPSFYFLDIQQSEADAFERFIAQRASGAALERVPMLRGRVVAANGVRAEELKPAASAAWVLQSDRGITYASELPNGSRIVAGEWWPPEYKGSPLVSLEKRVADGLGLNVGDTLTVNVLGRNIEARIANLRQLDWQTLGINFVLLFSPNTFVGAPHTSIATLTYPNGNTAANEHALVADAARTFPGITAVRVKDAIEAIAGLIGNLTYGIRGASLLAILSAMLVLAGALAASHHQRLYDAVILKTLGATRRQLLAGYTLEYLALALATALFGVAAGSIAAYFIVTEVMNLSFVWLPAPAFVAAAAAIVVTVGLGLLGTLKALGQKPAPVLRNL